MAKLPELFSKDELRSTELLFIGFYCYFSVSENLTSRYLDPGFAPGL